MEVLLSAVDKTTHFLCPKMFEVHTRNELCLGLRNQMSNLDLLHDHGIEPDGILARFMPFLENAFSNNVQH